MKVVKFGGSSLSSGEQLKKVFEIVVSDPERKVVVVSAPGKRSSDDIKVTDLLISCAERVIEGKDPGILIEAVAERYRSIANEAGIQGDIAAKIKENLLDLLSQSNKDPERLMEAVKASGEDQNARLVAEYFQSRGVNAAYINPGKAGLIVSDEPGNAQVLPESYNQLMSLREHEGIIIFPGFFGYSADGNIVTFSRSGSDITGSILANGLKADVYENFTDVDAVYAVNPGIVEKPEEIRELTYREMRELSYAGFSVFHDEALMPAFRAGIPVHVKNTNNPASPGTRIVSQRLNKNGPVVGIAADKGFCSIYVSKYLMNREIGFGRRLLQILEEFQISYEHLPSGIDDISVILRQDQLSPSIEKEILERIQSELGADEVKIMYDLSLIMVVGEGMRCNIGTMARASRALARAGVNIEMINQGSSEVSMMFGVNETDERKAVKAIYEEFFISIKV
ncbi:aspartate kinase [Mesobacillus zeae]|uniref:Aspartokinase n=1 Tax=Mesobacillus zeae TaxID=1917180 RepID=A0A398BEA2_9BACI|nr:aspartate kinase [Mesobacillus zeae]RID85916.1 aspartate kinase [Mesobacillus zeae]